MECHFFQARSNRAREFLASLTADLSQGLMNRLFLDNIIASRKMLLRLYTKLGRPHWLVVLVFCLLSCYAFSSTDVETTNKQSPSCNKDGETCSDPIPAIRSYALYYGKEIVKDEDRAATRSLIAKCREIREDKDTLQTFIYEDDSKDQETAITISTVAMKYGKVGARLWPSGIALSLYLAGTKVLKGKRTLELASGAGLPSMVAASENLGGAKDVMATDYWMDIDHPDDISSLSPKDALGREKTWEVPTREFGSNLAKNIGSERVRKLDYFNESNVDAVSAHFRPDVVIGSDVILYDYEVTRSVIKCIQQMLTKYGVERVVLLSPAPSNDKRPALEMFINETTTWTLDQSMAFRTIDISLCCMGYQCEQPRDGNSECGDFLIMDINNE